jgi:hypothetical protein
MFRQPELVLQREMYRRLSGYCWQILSQPRKLFMRRGGLTTRVTRRRMRFRTNVRKHQESQQ